MIHSNRMRYAVLVSALLLAACGGGGGDDRTSDPDSVPPSAGESVKAFLAYLQGLPSTDTSEPVQVGEFVAPVDDVGEPQSLD